MCHLFFPVSDGTAIMVTEGVTTTVSLEDVLIFASGSGNLPAVKPNPSPRLEVIFPPPQAIPRIKTFWEASTCLVHLKLPVKDTYNEFKENAIESIVGSPGFGQN